MTSRSPALLVMGLLFAGVLCSVGVVVASPWSLTPPPGATDAVYSRPARFTWPLAPPHPVVRPFQAPAGPYGPGHRGVDLGARPGAPVLAAGDGVVLFAGPVAGRGVVSLSHEALRTTYTPLTATVRAGQRVARGELLGHLTAGHEGCVRAPACLHWGARRAAEYVDPLGLLTSGRVRLLPWDGTRQAQSHRVPRHHG